MSSLWQRMRRWLGGGRDADESAPADIKTVELVVALRRAADDVHMVKRDVDRAAVARPDEDFTQARLFGATASVLEIIADTVTKGVVGAEAETGEGWRVRHAVALYRELIALLESARLCVARPPDQTHAVKVLPPLLGGELTAKAGAGELMAINDRLHEHFEAEVAYTRASRGGAEQARLNEFLGLLRSRTNLVESLLYDGLSGAHAEDEEQRLGRDAFGEMQTIWLLVAQEIVKPDITAELVLGPASTATGKYRPDNVWLMTDPVARARYRADTREAELEQDIRFEVLRGRPFGQEDVAFAQQLDWLEHVGVVKRRASYWATSPHQPIYRAVQAGQVELPGGTVAFAKGDSIAWLCQMGQEMAGTDRPILVGDLEAAEARKLCGDMRNAMMGAKMKRQMNAVSID